MEATLNMHSLFPTPIGQFEIPSLTEEQLEFVTNQDTGANVSNRISLDKYILEDRVMASLKSNLEFCLSSYYKIGVSTDPDIKLRITQSWITYTNVGESHHEHSHPNSIISGVYYVQTLGTDAICFHDNRRIGRSFCVNTPVLTQFNAPTYSLTTPQDSLVLFPSELVHSVNPRGIENVPDRISISFNTFYTGAIGREEDSTALIL